ncbi:MAG: hypothetical protein A2Y33_12700 [Spirochaetes bacterium GWF1_51_8]|nr:MAG: hypothetical protein A2Y33_12700 [Spirochaetes bacterium GWF1_51_8]
MRVAFVTEGRLIDKRTLELSEPTDLQIGEKVKLIIEPEQSVRKTRVFGCAKDWIEISPDFNEPLEEMKEYME